MNNTGLHHITNAGRFDRGSIMRRAAVLYRRYNGSDRIDWSVALRSAWGEAKGEMALFEARNRVRCTVMIVVAPGVSVAA